MHHFQTHITTALFCTFFFLFYFTGGINSTNFKIINNCSYNIWPATVAGGGSPELALTGVELQQGAITYVEIPPAWSGRLWARTGCTGVNLNCKTGDCGSSQVACNGAGGEPPATLVEVTMAENGGGLDFYDISLVDGFNLPVVVHPEGESNCSAVKCSVDVNNVCPPELAKKGDEGKVVACMSACMVFQEPQYCCTGEYSSPQTCKPSNYSEVFKRQCPQAYSFAFDDQSSIFTCTGGGDYSLIFCGR